MNIIKQQMNFTLGLLVLISTGCHPSGLFTKKTAAVDDSEQTFPINEESLRAANQQTALTNIGWIDAVAQNADGSVKIYGWACVKTYSQPIKVDLYLGGAAGLGGIVINRTLANIKSESAVSQACQSSGSRHRFAIAVPPSTARKHAGKSIFIHGINPFDRGNTAIGNSGNLKIPKFREDLTVISEGNPTPIPSPVTSPTPTPTPIVTTPPTPQPSPTPVVSATPTPKPAPAVVVPLSPRSVSAPILAADANTLAINEMSHFNADAPPVPINGGSRWITSAFATGYSDPYFQINGKNGAITHALTSGDRDNPFAKTISVKFTCLYNSDGFCINSDDSDKAFTRGFDASTGLTDVTAVWLMGVYHTGNNLLGIIHEETVGRIHGKMRLGLAWSTDQGSTWRYLGRIVSAYGDPIKSYNSNDPSKPREWNIIGAPYLIKDNYMYLYYNDCVTLTSGQCSSDGVAVARANLSSILAAAANGNVGDNLWKKYSGNGNWDQPGMGGLPTLTNIQGITHTQAIHSSVTGKYYLLTTQMNWSLSGSTVKLHESTDLVNWSAGLDIANEDPRFNAESSGYQYASLLDENGLLNGETTSKFNVYCFKFRDRLNRAPADHGQALYQWKVNLTSPTDFYRASLDFSKTQGNNGWSYLFSPDYLQMAWSASDSTWRGNETNDILGAGWMHPGTKETPSLVWAAPKDGTVNIRLVMRKGDLTCGNGVTGTVLKCNSTCTVLTSGSIDSSDSLGMGLNKNIAIKANESLWFQVSSKDGNNSCDATLLDPSIQYSN